MFILSAVLLLAGFRLSSGAAREASLGKKKMLLVFSGVRRRALWKNWLLPELLDGRWDAENEK